VKPGTCHALFGRNGAGKTTTIKCILNLLRPQRGQARVFGFDSVKEELEVKRRVAYVPDQVAFYPWMTIAQTFEYLSSFREKWNGRVEQDLIRRFGLNPSARVSQLSKGQKTQVALIAAICPETELLLLDEPTSGLDPIVRREFIQTVIGAFQESNPGHRTIFVSTHLISEFEGLIDEFTIMDQGSALFTLGADQARERYLRVRARFPQIVPHVDLRPALRSRWEGRELELIVNGGGAELVARLKDHQPESLTTETLTLEEIFIATLGSERAK
jgi:ABC-2 type transport system ATP-binding protein